MAKKSERKKGSKGSKSAASRERRARRATGGEKTDYRRKVTEQKREAANKKGGCLPKLFVLLVPFAAVGSYLILRA